MATDTRNTKWRYFRYGLAAILFVDAGMHGREFPWQSLAFMVSGWLAISCVIIGFYKFSGLEMPLPGYPRPPYVPHVRSLQISEMGITYNRRRDYPDSIEWSRVDRIELIREFDWDLTWGVNFYWRLVADNDDLRIWEEDESYRQRLLQACERYVPEFSCAEAQKCFHSHADGRWVCFQKLNVS